MSNLHFKLKNATTAHAANCVCSAESGENNGLDAESKIALRTRPSLLLQF